MPLPLPPWARVLVFLGEPILWRTAEALVDHFTQESDTDALEWRRLVLEVTRATPTGTTEDKASMSFDLINYTGGNIDPSWVSADFVTCEGYFDQWWDTLAPQVGNSHTLSAYKWYRMHFAEPMTADRRFALTGPPVRNQPKTKPGTNTTSELPYQIAISVTEKTAVPRHWGRFYFPGLTADACSSTSAPGRFVSSTVNAFADATAELYEDLQGSDFYPIVVSTQSNKVLTGAYHHVTSLQVDDIPDVIRRRRPRTPTIRRAGVPAP